MKIRTIDLVSKTGYATRGHAKGRGMLRRLKPYDEWIAGFPDEEIKVMQARFGCLRAFYEKFRSELIMIEEHGCELEVIEC